MVHPVTVHSWYSPSITTLSSNRPTPKDLPATHTPWYSLVCRVLFCTGHIILLLQSLQTNFAIMGRCLLPCPLRPILWLIFASWVVMLAPIFVAICRTTSLVSTVFSSISLRLWHSVYIRTLSSKFNKNEHPCGPNLHSLAHSGQRTARSTGANWPAE